MASKERILFLPRLLVIAALAAWLAGCQTSPTGRKQLTLIPDSQMVQMGSQAFSEMKQKIPMETGTKKSRYVECVSRGITKVVGGGTNWEVVLFKEDSPNAFALPGAKIGVHTGMLDVAKNEHQLATVIGHEIAHVLAEHGEERVSEQLAAQGGLTVLGAIMGNPKDPKHSMLMAALGLGAQYGVLLPHSRDQESEADIVGLELMAKAGFDPRASTELWENMAKSGGSQPPEFLSTHPSHGTRIENLSGHMPVAMQFYLSAAEKPACR